MEIEEFLYHYNEFHKEFCPNAKSEQKREKMLDEIAEFTAAVERGNNKHIIDESIDVMNTTIAYLISVGVPDPLFAGYEKLQKTAAKYRAIREGVMSRTDPQPQPIPNDKPAIWELVIKDMHDRDNFGESKYGTKLQPHNRRDFLVDAFQEALDLTVYLRGMLYERDGE